MKPTADFIKSALSIAGSILPSALVFAPNKRVILPAYHTVSETPPAHIKNLYKNKTPKEFIKDLDFLLRHFEPIDLNELIKFSHSHTKVKKNYFHLTFDDGLRECYDIILPILKDKGIPATFFINPSFVDNADLMHRYKLSLMIEDLKNSPEKKQHVVYFIKRKLGIKRDAITFLKTLRYSHRRVLGELAQIIGTDFNSYLSKQKPYLEKIQIKGLIENGFTIGAHSMDHPEFFMISEEEQLKQITESLKYINSEFQLPYNVFAFPFNDNKISLNLFNIIFNQAKPLADLTFGVGGLKKDVIPNNLQRIPMEKKFMGNQVLKGEYIFNYLNSIVGKNQINRK